MTTLSVHGMYRSCSYRYWAGWIGMRGARGRCWAPTVCQYQQFITRRRAERPIEEYRPPTYEELTAFGEHFGKRRVELGDCVRPYGTSCTHEHACVRCSFLQVDPAQADRLATIETDLNARIETARENAWLGDVEQLQLTLGHLHDKQDQVQRLLETLPSTPLITVAPTLTASASIAP